MSTPTTPVRRRFVAAPSTTAAPAPVPVAGPTPKLDRLVKESPDLVDRIFDFVVELLPEIANRRAQIKGALRQEFGAQEGYIRRREFSPQELEAEVERLLDEHGRNAYAVARILDIAPGTVYRKIKARRRTTRMSQAPLEMQQGDK